MRLLRFARPSVETVRRLLAAEGDQPFSYPEVGATRGDLPPGYAHAVVRASLGRGDPAFAAARAAIAAWRAFAMPWVELHGGDRAPTEGMTVALVARLLGLWCVSVARVVYIVDEVDRFGFAYGTVPAHVEQGEERFVVGRDPDGAVWYEIRVFSRPQRWWARLGGPVVTAAQRRFREDSVTAVRAAVSS